MIKQFFNKNKFNQLYLAQLINLTTYFFPINLEINFFEHIFFLINMFLFNWSFSLLVSRPNHFVINGYFVTCLIRSQKFCLTQYCTTRLLTTTNQRSESPQPITAPVTKRRLFWSVFTSRRYVYITDYGGSRCQCFHIVRGISM